MEVGVAANDHDGCYVEGEGDAAAVHGLRQVFIIHSLVRLKLFFV